jgi:hypothetical protein
VSPAKAVVVLHYREPFANAATINDHVSSFERYSRYPVITVNTGGGLPRALEQIDTLAVVLHYSIFGDRLLLSPRFRRWLAAQPYKVAFLQDEHWFGAQRAEFLTDFAVDCVFSLLQKEYHGEVYLERTTVRRVEHTLTGYVSDEMVRAARSRWRPEQNRPIDLGYRARELPFYMGRGAQEKHLIGREFSRRAAGSGLTLDLASEEGSRLYGDDWWDFLASCKGLLGVEAGVSVFDLDGTIKATVEEHLRAHPKATFEEVHERVLAPHEDRIFYRTVSPRHFEAAAFRNCQVLFSGRYNGIFEPGVHFLELHKDFSNFEEVLSTYSDPQARERFRDAAYEEVIASGRYT